MRSSVVLGSLDMSAVKPRTGRFGFTYLELITAVFVLALVSTGLMLRLVATQRGDQERGFRMGIARLATDARQAAIAAATPMTLRLDETGSSFRVMPQGDDTNGRDVEPRGRGVRLPPRSSIQELRVNGQTVAAAEWAVRFYPDGTCDAAALQIQSSGGSVYSVVFDPKTGTVRIEESQLADVGDVEERWEAGERELRGG